MNLSTILKEKREAAAINIPADKYAIMKNSTDELKGINLSRNALKTGDDFINFSLSNELGKKINSKELLKESHLIISFYRGGWCPYCNLELKALQNRLVEFKKLGANLIAISPEQPDFSLSTSEKNNLEFSVLSDVDNLYAKELGLVFKMPEALSDLYHSFNLDVKAHNGNNNYELPMPATYIVSKKGKIVHHFVPEDYTERLDPEVILEVLNKL